VEEIESDVNSSSWQWSFGSNLLQGYKKIEIVFKNVTLKFVRLTVVVLVVKKYFVLFILCVCVCACVCLCVCVCVCVFLCVAVCVCGLCYDAYKILQLIIFLHFGIIFSAVYFRVFKIRSVF
jgi:hypothetical protein